MTMTSSEQGFPSKPVAIAIEVAVALAQKLFGAGIEADLPTAVTAHTSGGIVVTRRANAQDSQLIRRGAWVRRSRGGSSPTTSSDLSNPGPRPGASEALIAHGCDRA
jgi:hypothetical protein